ncbi:MAG: nuclease [Betaproteobacteria bacterium HGW-Betaproteobacteria-12]|nr:MAG: nuclease [Betaproteobacteria bacterium HGW-Betaproteobacteria-12]
MIRILLAAVIGALSLPVSAELYHCIEGDRAIISDRPCGRQISPIPRGGEVSSAAPTVVQSAQTATQAGTITGYVVSIADGDTITVLDGSRQQHKIRLAGIDAPEKKQAYGERSRQSLAAMVFNKAVSVAWDKQDRYGRTVGKVMINGVDANLEQVKAGMAWWYEKYRKEQAPADQRLYAEAEQRARAGREGLWRDPMPVAPWDWRSAQRTR